MKTSRSSNILSGFAILCSLTVSLCISHGVDAQSGRARVGLPQDWSHRHVVFSSIQTQNVPLLLKVRQDPRVLHQWLRLNASTSIRENSTSVAGNSDAPGLIRRTNGATVDWSVTLGGANSILPRNQYPAKFSFDLNAPPDCVNDYVVFPTGVGGSATQATIVAFNHLYSTQGSAGGLCNQNGPSVKWSYNTVRPIRSSPVLSLDGTKVAWVDLNPGRVHVLTVGTTGANGASVTAPAVPGTGNNAVNKTLTLSGSPRVSQSSIFVDYQNDVGYVGDDLGVLHKITGIFNGTPTELSTGGWPIHVTASAAALTGPTFDSVSDNIFVTDALGNLSYVRESGSTVGACASGAPPCLGFPVVAVSPGTAIQDSPIVDFVTGRVFTETAAGGTAAQIIQSDTALGNVVRVNVGQQDGTHPMHSGAFDNNYFNNVGAGFYYVCGKSAGNTDPTLYRIGFDSSGLMNSAPDAATLRLARAAAECSPITEIFNTGTSPQKDWLFVAVSTRCGNIPVLPNGCIMSYDITNGMPTVLFAAVLERNGTSGIIIDNVSPAAQASNIYFTDQGTGACGDGIATGGCAVKLTQASLK